MKRHLISIGMVALAIGAALAFYLVSLRVSEERTEIAALQGSIARDIDDMRTLEATLHMRARLPQLETWNRQVLAMDAPTPKQMLGGHAMLVAYASGGAPVMARPAVVRAVAAPAPERAPAIIAEEVDAPAPPTIPASTARRGPVIVASAAATVAKRPRADTAALIAARVPAAEKPSLDELTQAIGQELQATDTPTVRHVSMR